MAGVDQFDAKTYIDVAVYHNILDKINVVEGIAADMADKWITRIRKEAQTAESYSSKCADYQVNGPIWSWINNNLSFSPNCELGRLIYFYRHLVSLLPSITPPNSYRASGTLLDEVRALEWEMNRVYLPLPFNFRQLTDKIRTLNNVSYSLTSSTKQYRGITTSRTLKLTDGGNLIQIFDLFSAYDQFFDAIEQVRIEVRREIDAANLHNEVAEEILRNEREELITREQEELRRQQEAERIMREKEAQYLEDYGFVIDMFNRTNSDLENAIDRMEVLLDRANDAQTESELVSITDQLDTEESNVLQLKADITRVINRAKVLIDAIINLKSSNAELNRKVEFLNGEINNFHGVTVDSPIFRFAEIINIVNQRMQQFESEQPVQDDIPDNTEPETEESEVIDNSALDALIAELEQSLSNQQAVIDELVNERDDLVGEYNQLVDELEAASTDEQRQQIESMLSEKENRLQTLESKINQSLSQLQQLQYQAANVSGGSVDVTPADEKKSIVVPALMAASLLLLN